MNSKRNSKGFTLIELMIVVVIVAILAAVAIPSYQNSIQKTRRADAKEALTRIAAMQERFFFTNNGYGEFSQLGLTATTGTAVEISSQEGFYNIRLLAGPTCGSTPARPCYTLQATATGAQADDTKCRLFTINETGRRQAFNSSNTNNTDECW